MLDIDHLKKTGYAELKIGSISSFADCLADFKAFFDQPLEKKMAYWLGDAPIPYRGYFPSKKQNYDENGKIFDLKEGFDVGRDLLTACSRNSNQHFFGQNLWPREVPTLEKKALQTLNVFRKISENLVKIFEEEMLRLGYQLDIESMFTRPIETQRALYYPAFDGDNSDFAPVVQHKDPGFFTLIYSEGLGPEYRELDRDSWHAIDYAHGKIFLNVGKTLEKLTSGYFQAPLHRLLSTPKNRTSLCYFFNPNYDAVIHPIAGGESFSAGREIFCCSIGYSENEDFLFRDQLENRVW